LLAPEVETLSRSVTADDLSALANILPAQLKRTDIVIVDLPSLGSLDGRVIETVGAVANAVPVIARLSAEQAAAVSVPDAWVVSFDTDSPQRLSHTIEVLLEQRDLRFRNEQLQRSITQQQQLLAAAREWAQSERARGYVSVGQYREALKTLSRLFSHTRDVSTLSDQFLTLLRELLGLSKLAMFLRPVEVSIFEKSIPSNRGVLTNYVGTASLGLASDIVRTVSLSTDSGIGHFVTAEGKILRRSQLKDISSFSLDPHITKEFDVLGTDFAMPIQDSETTLGVLTFSGKITGEELTAEDLEFIFALCNTVASAVKNIWLATQIASQQRFTNDVLAHVQSGVVVVNQQAQIAMANPRLFELLGLTATDVTERDIGWLPPAIADLMFETLHTGRAHSQREVTLPQANRVLSIGTSRFSIGMNGRDKTERVFAVGVIDDLTQLKREEALSRQAEDSKFMLQIASRLSHELRNSIVSIRTFAQLLPERFSDAAFRDEFSRTMQTEVARVDGLVGKINFFAQPLELDFKSVPVAEVIESAVSRVCAEVWHTAGLQGDFSGAKPSSLVTPIGKTINIQRHFTHTATAINADRKRLEEALMQLIRNAVQAMQDTGGRLTLGTEDIADSESSPSGIAISVSDTGTGIALKDFVVIFEPFYTTRNVGVGLGLAIAKKTVEAHRGRIELNSKLGKGTTMKVLLPVSRDADFSSRTSSRLTDEESATASVAAKSEKPWRFQPPKRGESE
jgi:signal transduction histidine kinase